jgi:transposase
MFYVGIDIAKNTHEVAIVSDSGDLVGSTLKVVNTTTGAQKLLDCLVKTAVHADSAVIGMEATGHYWLAIYSFLVGQGYTVKVINPIVTDAYRNMSVRKAKTDQIDAVVIAKVLRLGEYKESPTANEQTMALRQLCRFRAYEIDLCSNLKRKSIALLDQIFPEYAKLFSDTFGVASREVLMNYSTPEELSQINTKKLANLLDKASRGRFGKDKALQIKDTATHSLGIKIATDAFAFQLRQLLEQISFIEDQVEQLDLQIAAYVKRSDSFITTIPGVGPVLGAVILSEVGDISRFEDGKKLVAYAGIDASVSQSGNFEGTHMHMSKRGSPYLRRALYTAAGVAAFHDPELSAYYQRLRGRGKHHSVAVGAIARKLCYIVFSVLSENRPFEHRLHNASVNMQDPVQSVFK